MSFPFKDCLLTGGQSKEDDKRKEIFINEILSKDKIDFLKEKKVLVNPLKFTLDGEKSIDRFDNDNLVLKGNNYYSLCALLSKYRGKIKLIYIDRKTTSLIQSHIGQKLKNVA